MGASFEKDPTRLQEATNPHSEWWPTFKEFQTVFQEYGVEMGAEETYSISPHNHTPDGKLLVSLILI